MGFRDSLTLVLGILPHSRLKCLALGFLNGWHIAPSARIGACLFVHVRYLALDEEAVLSSGSVYRNLHSIRIGRRSCIGKWNTVSSSEELTSVHLPQAACLTIGRESAITNRHYIDCSGGVVVGAFSTIAGVRTTFLSHSIDLHRGRQRADGISIGDYTFVASNCSVMAGSTLPAKSVLAMGAVLRPGADREGLLYGGVPARPLQDIQGAYFLRKAGRVGV
jgi:acetyltransferase-like isoleucine patch superfamily enzyme